MIKLPKRSIMDYFVRLLCTWFMNFTQPEAIQPANPLTRN